MMTDAPLFSRGAAGFPGLAILALVCLPLFAAGCSEDDPMAPGNPAGVAETVELVLTARGSDDLPLAVDAGGVTTVAVGEEFNLDLGYIDHRPENERLGASQVFVDLLTNQADALRPVIGETLRLVVDEAIHTADPSGSVTFSLEGRVDSYSATGAAFTADPVAELAAALGAFGYVSGEDYALERLQYETRDIGLQITWNNARHGNEDMPDVALLLDFPQSVPSQVIEFSPVEADGVTLNAAALRFNVDTHSRGFNGDQEFYANQVEAAYDPATGFTRVGGIGPSATGGIPELSDDGTLAQPFDVFSLRVAVVAPVTGLTISASPSQAGDAIYMYGMSPEVAAGDIRMDGDHMLTIDAVVR